MDLTHKKEYQTMSVFVETRKIVRDMLHKQYGNKKLKAAWQNYQQNSNSINQPNIKFNYVKKGK